MQRQRVHTRNQVALLDNPSEFEYIRRQFPNRSHEEVHQAIKEARTELKEPEDHERIIRILTQKLAALP